MGRCSPSFSYLRYTNPAGLSALTEQPRGYVALEPPSPVDCESFSFTSGLRENSVARSCRERSFPDAHKTEMVWSVLQAR